jgi:glyoxylase-like metal-dependent hydrolase (beta-lactamase superfamily II)
MLHDTTIPVTQFQQNCSIVWCDEGKIAAIIDPGGDIDKLLAAIKKKRMVNSSKHAIYSIACCAGFMPARGQFY